MLGGTEGNMSALSQARAWALREVWREDGKPDYGMLTFIAGKVQKVGGGSPGKQAMSKFFKKLDDDPQWFPGKSTQETFGPSSVITPRNQATAARQFMALKKRGREPTYPNAVAVAADALRNPDTGEPVDKRRVYKIFETRCYDDPEDKTDTWKHRQRLMGKWALTDPQIEHRFTWSKIMLAKNHPAEWMYQKFVWRSLRNASKN